MILATHGFLASSIGQFDADAVAFFNRVTTAGGSLSTTEKTAVNTLVIQMKTDGIWTKMKAIYPMVGASAAACAQNLKSSSFTGTFNGGWTYASTGVKPNGTSAYMDSGLNVNSNLTISNYHVSIYSRTDFNAGSFQPDCGITNASTHGVCVIGTRNNGSAYFENGSLNAFSGISVANSLGMYILNSQNSTTTKLQKNNSIISTVTGTQTRTLFSTNLYFACYNFFGGSPYGFTPRENAFSSIGDGLTDTEAGNFYTAVQAFQTTLSRQV